LYQAVLADAKFHEQLLVFDRDLSVTARAAGCHLCGGALHSAQFARKPRGCPAGLSQAYGPRFSFCCAADGCRKRMTPPSLRFLGRKVYLATVVTLISALLLARRLRAWHACRRYRESTAGHSRAGVHGGVRPSPPAGSSRSPRLPSCRRSTSPACRPATRPLCRRH
jgi:hypothetical protein